MKINKLYYALIIGLLIGLSIGSLLTYFIMKDNSDKDLSKLENENTSITEKLSEEVKKLTLKNTIYNYVDIIKDRINELKQSKIDINGGMYLLFSPSTFKQVDEETYLVKNNGSIIDELDFSDGKLEEKSMFILNENGGIKEAVFYIDNYQITYDLLSTKVVKVEK